MTALRYAMTALQDPMMALRDVRSRRRDKLMKRMCPPKGVDREADPDKEEEGNK